MMSEDYLCPRTDITQGDVMKKRHILSIVVCIGAFLSLCISCKPVVTEKPQIPEYPIVHYDTLSLARGHWQAEIVHTASSNGEIYAYMFILGCNVDKQLDSVPYGAFNYIMMQAVTQDTLLPLGTYTAQSNDTRCYLISSSVASGAETERWLRAQGPYDIKDVSIHIDKDSAQNCYLDAFIQMKDGDNLYIHCTEIWRSYEEDRGIPISLGLYYPKNRN